MRIKRGLNKKARHNRVLELTKGYRGRIRKLYRGARKLTTCRSYNYADRQARRHSSEDSGSRSFRRLSGMASAIISS
jgi:ribosomal protein L20